MFQPESYVGHKLCWPGDLVINSLWAWGGGLGVTRMHGIVSTAYGVYRLRPGFAGYSAYFHELVRSQPFQWELQVRSKGIWISRLQLTDEAFLTAPFPVPPREDCEAIVRFLEYADRRVRRAIRAKQELIALLNEQKQAVIHRVVTRGLDPNVQLKPSGVDWLGEVPDHWAIRKLRHCGQVLGGMTPGMSERAFWGGDIPWVTPKDMKLPVIAESQDHITQQALDQNSLRLVLPGSVLLVVRGMILARRVPVARTAVPVTINQDMKAIAPSAGVDGSFLAYAIEAAQGVLASLVDEAGHGTKRLPTERWRDVQLALPPRREQDRIALHLDAQLAGIARAVASGEHEIELLREYRTCLSADVVTGKLDVREAAARLPQEIDDPELLGEIDVDETDDTDIEALEPVEA